MLKVDQELIRHILLLSNGLLTRVSLFTKMCELQMSQMFSMVLICLQDCPCQVSCLALQVCSVNYSNAWKSTILGQKSTMVYIQSNFKFFGQHQHFEVISIIWSRVDHDSSRNTPNSSKLKRSQMFSIVLTFLQDCPCQVSCLPL